MSADPRKKQKKLAKHAAKRKAKHHALVKVRNAGLAERLDGAVRYPVLHSWVSSTLWSEGIGSVVLSRELPNSHVAFAVFLVDRYCLGVKDAWGEVVASSAYEERIVRGVGRTGTPETFSPEALRKLVEDAVAYAEALGLPPHADYHRVKAIFGDIDAGACPDEFEFGDDGQPFFVAGPHDTPVRCRRILTALEKCCGVGNFHYLAPWANSEGNTLPESLRPTAKTVIGTDKDGVVREYPELLPKESAER